MVNLQVEADLDFDLRRGGGVEDDRPLLSYAEFELMQARGVRPSRYALVYLAPPEKGGLPIAMPAEKHGKWFGQGYRPVVGMRENGTMDLTLWEYPEPPMPVRWTPSMIENAIAHGDPIPEHVAPPGYIGAFTEPVVVEGAGVVPAEATGTTTTIVDLSQPVPSGDSGGTALLDAETPAPELFYCDVGDCTRFFDSPQGRGGHKARDHKAG